MRAVFLEAPEALLDERRRLGVDRRDEMWDGVLHVVPPAGGAHQRTGGSLYRILAARADELGLIASYETGLYRTGTDYRVPDQLYYSPDAASERGAEGAELVVEIRSPGDESYAKLDFFAAVGVREVLVVHPEGPTVELFRLAGDRLLPVTADDDGAVRLDTLGVRFVPGTPMMLTWSGGEAPLRRNG